MATLTTWLASQGASLLLGWLAQFMLSAWDKYTANKNASDLAKLQERDGQSQATIAAQQAELQAQADAPRTPDEAIARLEEGSA